MKVIPTKTLTEQVVMMKLLSILFAKVKGTVIGTSSGTSQTCWNVLQYLSFVVHLAYLPVVLRFRLRVRGLGFLLVKWETFISLRVLYE